MKNFNYTQPTLMETISNALDFLNIDPDDFNLKPEYFANPHSHNHGYQHVYRVMLATALIAYHLQEKKGLLAWCAAFVHDMAKEHGGEGASHAENAATQKVPQFQTLWKKYGLTDAEISIVQDAVWRHCSNNPNDFQTDGLVWRMVKDADGLDRCRFRQSGRYNWDYANLAKLQGPSDLLKQLISETEAICAYTKFLPTDQFVTLNEFISQIR